MSTNQPAPPAPKDPSEYFYNTALEYYISGRAALLCGNSLVTGNLLHHAVEMLLKGQLLKIITLEDLKNPEKFGHKLLPLWLAFNALVADLAEFDDMIKELDKFEKIRYPDKILRRGAFIVLGFRRGKAVTKMTPRRKEPKYQLGIGDVDACFAQLFPLCGINPPAYFGFLSPFGRQVLTEENAESKDWLP
jgi:hypothetical protein